MVIKFYEFDRDNVIDGFVCHASASYEFAIEHLLPLIEKLDIQRNTLKTKFYSRLEADIVKGCVMPPITVALIHEFQQQSPTHHDITAFIIQNINEAFILDGIQRLNTLGRAAFNMDFNPSRHLYINFIIANSRDKLLYRMITLNNGQKAMSARHQIEILADTFFDFDNMPLKLVPEKGNGRVRAPDTFKKADFVKGYIAYLSNSVNIDNQRIIEEKMDDLIASRIIDSDIPQKSKEFSDVINIINDFGATPYLRDWIRVQNNFIGFCVGASHSLTALEGISSEEMQENIESFEQVFSSINASKVSIGKYRRELVAEYIKNIETLAGKDEFDLLDWLSRRTEQ